ncbi:hypothetical protein ACWC4J_17400 [Streptomyces sp. NPDC001356]
MSRKYPKKVRKEYAAKLKAAEAFVESVTTSGAASDVELGNCNDAETYAALLRAFGYTNYAEDAIGNHKVECDDQHRHEPDGVWEFDFNVYGPNIPPDTSYTVVMDGKTGAEAEDAARDLLRRLYQQENPSHGYFWLTLVDVERGAPATACLYSWIDGRKAA